MDKFILAIQVLLFCFFFYKTTFSEDNPTGWEEWIDVSICTAKPCNCSSKDRVQRIDECSMGRVLQVRGCLGDVCQYREGIGSIRKKTCRNLNKLCPGWSDWKVSDVCRCAPNKTTGWQSIERTCTNPPPVEGLGVKCVINDQEEGLEETATAKCNCTDEIEETTTEATTTATPMNCSCDCSNTTSQESIETIETIDSDESTTTSTTTVSTTPDPYGLSIDYDQSDDDQRCNCQLICSKNVNGTATSTFSNATTGENSTEPRAKRSIFDDSDYFN